jgi:hypothetical protein
MDGTACWREFAKNLTDQSKRSRSKHGNGATTLRCSECQRISIHEGPAKKSEFRGETMSTKKILGEEHFAAIPGLIQSGLNKRQTELMLLEQLAEFCSVWSFRDRRHIRSNRFRLSIVAVPRV